MRRRITTIAIVLLAGTAWMTMSATPAAAQPVWALNGASFQGHTEGFADDPMDAQPPCHNIADVGFMTPGLIGKDTAGISYADCGLLIFTCPLRGQGYAHFWIDGVGTPQVTMRWYVISRANHTCERIAYRAFGIADLLAGAVLEPTNLPDGTPVTVDYRWWQWSFNNWRPEAAIEDPAHVLNGFLDLDGTLLFNGDFDLDKVPGIKFKPEERGSFGTQAGIPLTVDVGVETYAEINNPGRGVYNEDTAATEFFGEIILSLSGPPVSPGGSVIPYSQLGVEFSLDIGSDTELSDPNLDGDEVFDPGDAYWWKSAPLVPPGASGIKDDGFIFGLDPAPTPGLPNPAPTCSGFPPSQVEFDYFDLDGHDALELSLSQVLPPISDGPPIAPIPYFPSQCVTGTDFLVISYDDDTSGHYVGTALFCEVPVRSQSPAVNTYGTSPQRDEIIGLNLINVFAPALVAGQYPIEDEPGLHPSLFPPPDVFEDDDDDVDSLDINFDLAVCDTWYFSPDHEATYFDTGTGITLDPGGIYEVIAGGGMVQVIDEVVHLGLPEDTDIDAFEFVWAEDVAAGGGFVLTLLFSVDDDDWLTAGDESGGLDPRMIYASDLTGGHYPYIDAPLGDDVDALTAWWSPVGQGTGPNCVCGDLDFSSGPVDLVDFATFATCFGLPPTSPPCDCADLNSDGSIDLTDFATFAVTYGTTSTNAPPNCP